MRSFKNLLIPTVILGLFPFYALAQVTYLRCGYEDKVGRGNWIWAEIEPNEYIQLHGDYQNGWIDEGRGFEDFFLESQYSEEDAKKICNYSVLNISDRDHTIYRFTGEMRASISFGWKNYRIHFSPQPELDLFDLAAKP